MRKAESDADAIRKRALEDAPRAYAQLCEALQLEPSVTMSEVWRRVRGLHRVARSLIEIKRAVDSEIAAFEKDYRPSAESEEEEEEVQL